MKRIAYLILLSLLLVIGIVSCDSSVPIPADMPEADSIIIWYEGKDIHVEEENSLFNELSIEAVKAVNEAHGFCQSYPPDSSAIDWKRQNLKCLEIEFKEPYRIVDDPDFMEGKLIISAVLFPFHEDFTNSVMTYSESTRQWTLWLGERSTDELVRMTDEYLAASR
ncbi:MAG: hypothetical protein JXA46_04270 [Dehalococcoidales bacterium]|nr:hypothetical protein [Dehalococcoidales bacterium]